MVEAFFLTGRILDVPGRSASLIVKNARLGHGNRLLRSLLGARRVKH